MKRDKIDKNCAFFHVNTSSESVKLLSIELLSIESILLIKEGAKG